MLGRDLISSTDLTPMNLSHESLMWISLVWTSLMNLVLWGVNFIVFFFALIMHHRWCTVPCTFELRFCIKPKVEHRMEHITRLKLKHTFEKQQSDSKVEERFRKNDRV